ncbi:MAG TPA: cation diffusion facilitator family transporter [Geminicoccaceae bacterium]
MTSWLRLPADPHRLNRLAVLASVLNAGLLIALKLVLWLLSGSITLLASLVDSSVDAVASLITLVTLRQAAQPADHAHRFGHGKAEALGALLQAAFLAGLALMVGIQAVQRLIEPVPLRYGSAAIAAMVVAILLTLLLVSFQRIVIRRTGSIAVEADSWHYRGDLATNLAALLGLAAIEATGLTWIDPLVACAIVVMLLTGATGIGRRALDMLMDRELPQASRDRIMSLARDHPDARDVHDLRTRQAGSDVFIELHLELDGGLALRHAHDITHEVEDRIRGEFPSADIVVHQEPAGLADERLDEAIRKLAARS